MAFQHSSAQVAREEKTKHMSQLDIQILRMNEIINKESKDEMMLFTVNNSL